MSMAEALTLGGEPVPPLLAEARRGPGRPKGSGKPFTSESAREAARKGNEARKQKKGKPQRTPRAHAPRASRTRWNRQTERYAELAIGAMAGGYPISAVGLGALVGMADITKLPEWRELDVDQQAAILEEQRQAQRIVDAVIARLRSWCPEADRFTLDEVQLAVHGLSLQAKRIDKATDEVLGPIGKILAPFLPVLKATARESQTAAIVAALAIPRLVGHGWMPGIIGRIVYPAVRMAAGRAPNADRADGLGQEHASRGADDAARVRDRDQDEGGSGEVPGSRNGEASAGDGLTAEP